jgi:hypothetical protein
VQTRVVVALTAFLSLIASAAILAAVRVVQHATAPQFERAPVRVDLAAARDRPRNVVFALHASTLSHDRATVSARTHATGLLLATTHDGTPVGEAIVPRDPLLKRSPVTVNYETTAASLVLETPALITSSPLLATLITSECRRSGQVAALAAVLRSESAARSDYLTFPDRRLRRALRAAVADVSRRVAADLAPGQSVTASAAPAPPAIEPLPNNIVLRDTTGTTACSTHAVTDALCLSHTYPLGSSSNPQLSAADWSAGWQMLFLSSQLHPSRSQIGLPFALLPPVVNAPPTIASLITTAVSTGVYNAPKACYRVKAQLIGHEDCSDRSVTQRISRAILEQLTLAGHSDNVRMPLTPLLEHEPISAVGFGRMPGPGASRTESLAWGGSLVLSSVTQLIVPAIQLILDVPRNLKMQREPTGRDERGRGPATLARRLFHSRLREFRALKKEVEGLRREVGDLSVKVTPRAREELHLRAQLDVRTARSDVSAARDAFNSAQDKYLTAKNDLRRADAAGKATPQQRRHTSDLLRQRTKKAKRLKAAQDRLGAAENELELLDPTHPSTSARMAALGKARGDVAAAQKDLAAANAALAKADTNLSAAQARGATGRTLGGYRAARTRAANNVKAAQKRLDSLEAARAYATNADQLIKAQANLQQKQGQLDREYNEMRSEAVKSGLEPIATDVNSLTAVLAAAVLQIAHDDHTQIACAYEAMRADDSNRAATCLQPVMQDLALYSPAIVSLATDRLKQFAIGAPVGLLVYAIPGIDVIDFTSNLFGFAQNSENMIRTASIPDRHDFPTIAANFPHGDREGHVAKLVLAAIPHDYLTHPKLLAAAVAAQHVTGRHAVFAMRTTTVCPDTVIVPDTDAEGRVVGILNYSNWTDLHLAAGFGDIARTVSLDGAVDFAAVRSAMPLGAGAASFGDAPAQDARLHVEDEGSELENRTFDGHVTKQIPDTDRPLVVFVRPDAGPDLTADRGAGGLVFATTGRNAGELVGLVGAEHDGQLVVLTGAGVAEVTAEACSEEG